MRDINYLFRNPIANNTCQQPSSPGLKNWCSQISGFEISQSPVLFESLNTYLSNITPSSQPLSLMLEIYTAE